MRREWAETRRWRGASSQSYCAAPRAVVSWERTAMIVGCAPPPPPGWTGPRRRRRRSCWRRRTETPCSGSSGLRSRRRRRSPPCPSGSTPACSRSDSPPSGSSWSKMSTDARIILPLAKLLYLCVNDFPWADDLSLCPGMQRRVLHKSCWLCLLWINDASVRSTTTRAFL